MKKSLLFLLTMILVTFSFTSLAFADPVPVEDAVVVVADNSELPDIGTDPTIANAKEASKTIAVVVENWKGIFQIFKSGSITFDGAVSSLVQLIITLYTLGMCLLLLIGFIKLFTPQVVDDRLDKLGGVIKLYLIDAPVEILAKIRGTVRKDKA